MASALTCTQRILEFIERFRDDTTKPPVNEAELAVMALLMSRKTSTEHDISLWIVNTFRYYANIAFEVFSSLQAYWDPTRQIIDCPARRFKEDLFRALHTFDIPLKVTVGRSSNAYDISETDGHQFLSRVTGFDDRLGTFPFFELPPELRNRVYELVFQYPITGIKFGSNDGFAIISKSLSREREVLIAATTGEQILLRRFREILAPLQTSRQFCREALPYFYQLNHFVFADTEHLISGLGSMSEERLNHIKRISFNVQVFSKEAVDVAWAFSILSRMEGLKQLHIRINEQMELDMALQGKSKSFRSVTNIPGLSILRRVRGLTELTFEGCPKVEAMIREDMMKPRPKKRASSSTSSMSSKKRKADDGEADGLRRSARIKRAKA